MRLHDFVLVEFARAWQEERGASVADPAVVAAVAADPSFLCPQDDDARLLAWARRLLRDRVDGEDGTASVAVLQGGLAAARWLLPLVGVLAGVGMLHAGLPPNDVRPANVLVIVAEGVLLPSIFLLATLLLVPHAGRLAVWAHPLAWTLAVLGRGALRTRVGALAGRVLARSGAGASLFAALSHLFWIGVLSAFLGLAAWRFAFDDYLFSWSSTMPISGDGVRDVFGVLVAPIGWLPWIDAPSPEQVAVSEYASLEAAWAWSTGDGARDEALRKGWYLPLLAVVAFWGLLPRLAGLAWAGWRLRSGIRRALDSPGNREILLAIEASSSTSRIGDAGHSALADARPSPTPGRGTARGGGGLDVVAFAAQEPSTDRLAASGLVRLGLSGKVHVVADDDDENAIAEVLGRLGSPGTAPGGAVVVFDLLATPGRLHEGFLRAVVGSLGEGSPVHVLLIGAERFRRGPRGRRFDDRHRSWLGMAARAGVPAPFVHVDEEAG